MAMKQESALVLKIKKELNSYNQAFFFKIHGGPMQMAGISDIIGIYKGKFVSFEVKTPSNKKGTTKLQDWFIDTVNQCGGHAYVIKSVKEANDIMSVID